MEPTKICVGKNCPLKNIPQSLYNFHRSKNNKGGYQTLCKECHWQRVKLWREKSPQYKIGEEAYNKKNRKKLNERQKWWARENPSKIREIREKQYDRQINIKLFEIKKQNCICPGCGFDFNACPDKALAMCFEKSHVHHRKCSLRNNNDFFWSCRVCNCAVQGKKCGYWLSPNNFKQLCINQEGTQECPSQPQPASNLM